MIFQYQCQFQQSQNKFGNIGLIFNFSKHFSNICFNFNFSQYFLQYWFEFHYFQKEFSITILILIFIIKVFNINTNINFPVFHPAISMSIQSQYIAIFFNINFNNDMIAKSWGQIWTKMGSFGQNYRQKEPFLPKKHTFSPNLPHVSKNGLCRWTGHMHQYFKI